MTNGNKTEFLIEAQQIPVPTRYSFIFRTFGNLARGESLTIVHNHDPLPLLIQFTALKEEDFEHEYIENGPSTWVVKLKKTKLGDCCGFCGN